MVETTHLQWRHRVSDPIPKHVFLLKDGRPERDGQARQRASRDGRRDAVGEIEAKGQEVAIDHRQHQRHAITRIGGIDRMSRDIEGGSEEGEEEEGEGDSFVPSLHAQC